MSVEVQVLFAAYYTFHELLNVVRIGSILALNNSAFSLVNTFIDILIIMDKGMYMNFYQGHIHGFSEFINKVLLLMTGNN